MIGDIDSTIPNGVTHLIDRQSEFYQQHGGVVTQVHYDTLEEMTLDTFLKEVAPTLKDRKDTMTVIRDTVRDNMYRILGDSVAVFHMTEIKDVFFDTFVDRLLCDRPLELTLNLTYPMVYYATKKDGTKKLCVHIPAKQFIYHVREDLVKPFPVWHPPLWFGVTLNAANIPQRVYIGVVLEKALSVEDVKLYHLPLPNCYSSGEICYGGTHITNPNKDATLTESMALELKYNQLFNSAFNMDLTQRNEMDNMEALIKSYPDGDTLLKEIHDTRSDYKQHALRIKYAFRDQASVWKFRYNDLCSGKQFLERL